MVEARDTLYKHGLINAEVASDPTFGTRRIGFMYSYFTIVEVNVALNAWCPDVLAASPPVDGLGEL
eukprot:m.222110 g.222110  ORF g.222110 m.222110 type:complete len:66 (-) comp25819_c1_seq3:4534-4731(-)